MSPSGEQQLDDTVIRAPFAGVVTSKNAQPGEMISPMSSGGFTRTGICTIVDMESLEIEIDVNESYINRVTPGQDPSRPPSTPTASGKCLAG
jgi:HlyD family secretion protein